MAEQKKIYDDLFIFEMANSHQGSVEHGIDIIKATVAARIAGNDVGVGQLQDLEFAVGVVTELHRHSRAGVFRLRRLALFGLSACDDAHAQQAHHQNDSIQFHLSVISYNRAGPLACAQPGSIVYR